MGLITSGLTIDTLIFLSFITLLIYLYLTRNFNHWKKRGVKEIKPSFPFGNVGSCIFSKENPYQYLTRIYYHAEGERVFGFHVLDRPYLLIRDTDLIRHILIKDFHNFSNKLISSSKDDILGSRNLFLVRNPPWKFIRHKMTPMFSSGKLKKMYELMLEICDDLQCHMDSYNIDDKIGKKIDVKELCAKFSTDLIGTTAFGLKLNSLKDPDAEFRKHGRDMFRNGYKRYLQWLSMLFVPQLRPLMKPKFFDEQGTIFLTNSFWYTIKERQKSGIRRNDVIDLLIDMMKAQENDDTDMHKLEGDELVAQAAVFFSGGFETSSTTMTFAFYELAKNPEMQNRLRDEIVDGLKQTGGKMTYDMITALPYLNMVIQETLRMYPILPFVDRTPDEDYTLPDSNIRVKKDTPMIIPMRVLHMDPKYFPKPNEFNPERFSKENKANIVPYSYLPFGEGPRNCIGERLGYLQVKLGLVHLIHKYTFEHCEETRDSMKINTLNVFTQPNGDMYLRVKKISS